jgi:SAM-dependent methyltransferase
MPTLAPTPALAAYESLAPGYDAFTAGHDHDLWLRRILALALAHGLAGRRVLDVACGTGKSTAPLVARGFDVTACDISPSMAALATRRLGPTVSVSVADMRDLPARLGTFDLVVCLDDSINYLGDREDLVTAFASVARLLHDRGIYVFDVNTLAAYRASYEQPTVTAIGGAVFCWRGDLGDAPAPDGLHEAQLDAFLPEPDGRVARLASHHVQRHFGDETIRSALAEAGLRCVEVVGQLPGVRFSRPADDDVHAKRLYVARSAR